MKKPTQELLNAYLDILNREGKDTSDPTYLMQAFGMTKAKSLVAIYDWQHPPCDHGFTSSCPEGCN